jgi:hypothetical protein
MNSILNFLSTSPEVTVVALLIMVCSLLAYWFWYRTAVRSVSAGLRQLMIAVGQKDDGWAINRDKARQIIKRNPRLAASWLETEERVTDLPVGDKFVHVMFGLPKDIWNPSTLLSRSFNLGLAEAVPNILVGVGLLFTFLFLSIALSETTAVLGSGANSARTQLAIESLLKVAGAKFLTSLAGLLTSLIWTLYSKRAFADLAAASDSFLESLGRAVPPNGGELVMQLQVQLAGRIKNNSDDSLGLTEELLKESREQTGTFKRFETDLAVSLAGAITKSFTPQMEAMTEKLVGAIDGLSEKLGTMNQEALQQMLQDFASMLKQATDSEMAELRSTLQELAANLEGAGAVFGEGATGAATAINQAGSQLVEQVQQIAQNLAAGATNLEGAAGSIKLAMNDLEVTLMEASNIGQRGAIFVNDALEKAGTTIERLGSVSSELVDASHAMETVGGQIANVVDTVEELSREQRAVVLAVKEVAPTALAAVERVTGVLSQAASQTLGVMQQTKDSMESTATTLGKTVASITEGVTVYTNQVAELHRKMDGQFAKAVGSFDKGVTDLAESVEELAEVMQVKKRAQ